MRVEERTDGHEQVEEDDVESNVAHGATDRLCSVGDHDAATAETDEDSLEDLQDDVSDGRKACSRKQRTLELIGLSSAIKQSTVRSPAARTAFGEPASVGRAAATGPGESFGGGDVSFLNGRRGELVVELMPESVAPEPRFGTARAAVPGSAASPVCGEPVPEKEALRARDGGSGGKL